METPIDCNKPSFLDFLGYTTYGNPRNFCHVLKRLSHQAAGASKGIIFLGVLYPTIPMEVKYVIIYDW